MSRRTDPALLRGLLLLAALLLGVPLLIGLVVGLVSFALQPPLPAVSLDAPDTALLGQELTLDLRISNPHDDPLILSAVHLDRSLLAGFEPPQFDPPPFQQGPDAAPELLSVRYHEVLGPGQETGLVITLRPRQAGQFDGRVALCRPGPDDLCAILPLTITVAPP